MLRKLVCNRNSNSCFHTCSNYIKVVLPRLFLFCGYLIWNVLRVIIDRKRHQEETFIKQVARSKEQETVDNIRGGMAELAVDENKFKKDEDAKKRFVPATATVTAKKNDDDNISFEEIGSVDESESESDDTSDEDAKNRYGDPEPASPKYARAQKMNLSHFTEPQPAIPPLSCGSRLLFMMNLNPSTEESDVCNFFKDDGKVVSVDFSIEGQGHVRFETYDEARLALKRNGEMLKGYPVKLYYSKERTIWDLITPDPKYKYLFMGNLNPSIKKSDVVKFFKDDGTVKLVRLMTDDPDFVGYGHVKFATFGEALKAVQRDGDKLLDHKVELVLASESSVWDAYTPNSRNPRDLGLGETQVMALRHVAH